MAPMVTWADLARVFSVPCKECGGGGAIASSPDVGDIRTCHTCRDGKVYPLLEPCPNWDWHTNYGQQYANPRMETCSGFGVFPPCKDGLVPLDPDRGFVVLLEELRKQGCTVTFEPDAAFCHIEAQSGAYWTGIGLTWRDALIAAALEMQKQEGKG